MPLTANTAPFGRLTELVSDAVAIARRRGDSHVGVEHLWAACLRQEPGQSRLSAAGTTTTHLEEIVDALPKGTSEPTEELILTPRFQIFLDRVLRSDPLTSEAARAAMFDELIREWGKDPLTAALAQEGILLNEP